MTAAVALVAGSALGQQAAVDGAGDEVNPRERVNRRFDRAAPAVGEALPGVSGYDADGRPFPLSRLKGRPTVVVFGCLT